MFHHDLIKVPGRCYLWYDLMWTIINNKANLLKRSTLFVSWFDLSSDFFGILCFFFFDGMMIFLIYFFGLIFLWTFFWWIFFFFMKFFYAFFVIISMLFLLVESFWWNFFLCIFMRNPRISQSLVVFISSNSTSHP